MPTLLHSTLHTLQAYLTATGHKRVGWIYLLAGYAGGCIGWILSVLIRITLTSQGLTLIRKMKGCSEYNGWISAHGLAMLFVYVMPIGIGGFGNYMLPLLLGTSELVLPRLNGASAWFLLSGIVLFLVAQVIIGKGLTAGWTLYPPLSTRDADSLTLSTDASMLAVHLLGFSSAIGGTNMIVTTLTARHNGLTLQAMQLYLWSLLVTNFLLVATLPVLAVAVTLILLDRNVGTSVYDGVQGGDPVLFQHLFWFFGHPEVYIIILPVFGLVSLILGTTQHRAVFGQDGMVYCLLAIGIVGFAVWGHHMFTAGLDIDTRSYFSAATAIISIPTGVKVFSYLASLSGARSNNSVVLSTIWSFLGCFIIGGLGGLMLSASALDEQLHDTYFVVGHFHTVLSLGAMFGLLTAMQLYSPHMTGTALNEGVSKAYTTNLLVGALLTFLTMHNLGLASGLRRIPEYMDVYAPYQVTASIGMVLIVCGVLGQARTTTTSLATTPHLSVA